MTASNNNGNTKKKIKYTFRHLKKDLEEVLIIV